MAKLADGLPNSVLAKSMTGKGLEVWDGLTGSGRREIAHSPDQYRLIQYDSCRGLEGWIVFCLGFDDFWNYKFESSLADDIADSDLFGSAEEEAKLEVARWCMIAILALSTQL